jgi:hypothetical protein
MRRFSVGLITFCCLGAMAGVQAAAQTQFRTRVIAQNLERPSGIAVSSTGTVYFTQLPTPGVGGNQGGSNKVSELRRTRLRNLTVGEPEPTNISVDFLGGIYWTCKSANVILEFNQKSNSAMPLATGLNKPSGIAAYPFGQFQFFTEVPTPGVSGANGGENTVNVFLDLFDLALTIDEGDPEPTDVAVDLFGNIYWTCTSAGVIVRQSKGVTSVIASGLNKPTGLATDFVGNLYFTEVPTPGVSLANGGSNAVSRLDLSSGEITVVNFGDPDPIDVAVQPFGKTVYWTCRSAGVIVEARPR